MHENIIEHKYIDVLFEVLYSHLILLPLILVNLWSVILLPLNLAILTISLQDVFCLYADFHLPFNFAVLGQLAKINGK